MNLRRRSVHLFFPCLIALCFAQSSPKLAFATSIIHLSSQTSQGGFELNVGQHYPEGKYLFRGMGYTFLLTSTGAAIKPSSPVLAREDAEINRGGLTDSNANSGSPPRQPVHNQAYTVLRMALAHSNPAAKLVGKGELASYSNYMIGHNPANWHLHVPQFREVWYEGIYPGVDLVYRSRNKQVEYDFRVAPYANPHVIGFSLEGVSESSPPAIDSSGDLVLGSSSGNVLLRKPVLYQGRDCLLKEEANDEPGGANPHCRFIPGGRFVLRRDGKSAFQVGFKLPAYDHSQTLVIDPTISFSTFLGGGIDDGAVGMATDAAGNIYVAGFTNSPDFPVTPGAFQTGLNGIQNNVFISKLSPDGSHLIYSTYLGGTGGDTPVGIAVDAAGSAYVTGTTFSNDFPVVNAYQPTKGTYAAFLSKLTPDGSGLVYSTYFGSRNQAGAIAVDSLGEAIIVGNAANGGVPLVNAIQPIHGADHGSTDAFVAKFNSAGSAPVFSTYWGGNGGDYATGVSLGSTGNIFVTGVSTSMDFPVTPGAFQGMCVISNTGFCQASFVSVFNPMGSALAYSTYLDGASASAIAVDSAGEAFVTGNVSEGTDFVLTPGAFQTVQGGGASQDAFVTKFNSSGSGVVYSTYLGGNSGDYGNAIATDASGNAYVTGDSLSTNFPLQSPLQSTLGGTFDSFISELNSSGTQLLFSTYFGGGPSSAGDEHATGISVDSSGSITVVGNTSASDFPSVNALQPQLRGFGNAYIAKIAFPPDFSLVGTPNSATVAPGQQASYSLTLTPLYGLNQSVNFTCSGAPTGAICDVSPASITPSGSSTTAMVTVNTNADSSALVGKGVDSSKRLRPLAAEMGTLLIALAFGGSLRRVRRRPMRVWLGLLAIFCCIGVTSCGGGSSGSGGGKMGSPTPPGTYTLTVTGASGTGQSQISHSVQFMLVVN